MKVFVEKLIDLLADDSSAVNVKENAQDNLVTFEIACPSTQIGRLIGKSGHNIRALRALLNVKGTTQGKQAVVKLLEPAG